MIRVPGGYLSWIFISVVLSVGLTVLVNLVLFLVSGERRTTVGGTRMIVGAGVGAGGGAASCAHRVLAVLDGRRAILRACDGRPDRLVIPRAVGTPAGVGRD